MAEKDVLTKAPEASFDYFSAKNFAPAETTTETVEREVERFNNNYSSSKLEKVYEKYELLEEEPQESLGEDYVEETPRQSEFSKLLRNQTSFEEVEEKIVVETPLRQEKVKLELNERTKLAVFTYAFCAVMLGFLLVYNAFAIGNINSNINNLNSSIEAEQIKIDRVIKDIGNMTDEDNILDLASDLSFSELDAGQIINVNLYTKQQPISYTGQTNWFDKLCEFVKGVFGG